MEGIRHPFESAPAEGQTTEVAPGILWLRLPLPTVLDHVNVFALDDGDGWTLVDTGMDTRRSRAAWQAALDGPLSGRPVRRVIVTHYHPDHIGLAGWFQAQGAELLTSRTSWLYARMLVLDRHDRHPPEVLAFQNRAGVTGAALAAKAEEKPFNFADVVAPLPPGFTRLSDGDLLTAGGRNWRIRFGQGHAPDHVTLFSESDHLVLGGDQLLPGISANLGVYPTEPDADPVTEWMDSARALQAHAREDQLVLPGHKLPFTGLPLRLRQMIENHEGALDRLMDHLATPKAATDCFPPLFKREVGPAVFGLALVEAVAHLNCLLRQGRVVRSLSADGVWLWQVKA